MGMIDYVNQIASEYPRLAQTARTVFLSADPAPARDGRVWERLILPDRIVRFRVVWPDRRGQLCCTNGYLAFYGGLPCPSAAYMHPGFTADEVVCRAFLRMLSGALAGGRPGLVVGADLDPAALTDTESMLFCRAFRDALAALTPDPALLREAWSCLPPRERGYLEAWRPTGPEPPLSQPEAAGIGMCLLAEEMLRRRGRGGLWGKTAAIRGEGPQAEAAQAAAARMGASLTGGAADVVLLCAGAALDREGVAGLLGPTPPVILEGAEDACTPEAAALLTDSGLPFLPFPAGGAGAALAGALPPDLTPWQARGRLRRAMASLPVSADRPGACYAAALDRAAALLLRRGLP